VVTKANCFVHSKFDMSIDRLNQISSSTDIGHGPRREQIYTHPLLSGVSLACLDRRLGTATASGISLRQGKEWHRAIEFVWFSLIWFISIYFFSHNIIIQCTNGTDHYFSYHPSRLVDSALHHAGGHCDGSVTLLSSGAWRWSKRFMFVY
jgi:hypothetical protein